MVTVAVAGGVTVLGASTDAVTLKVSLSSTTISPSMLTDWHTDASMAVSISFTRGWKSPESGTNIKGEDSRIVLQSLSESLLIISNFSLLIM